MKQAIRLNFDGRDCISEARNCQEKSGQKLRIWSDCKDSSSCLERFAIKTSVPMEGGGSEWLKLTRWLGFVVRGGTPHAPSYSPATLKKIGILKGM